jgi:outer membrane protein assembly factor BamB
MPFTNQFGNGPRSTPVVDGELMYTLGVTGILACWDSASGRKVWETNIITQFEAPRLFFGVSSTPIIEGDRLLVLCGGREASIVAFDKKTGGVLWKSGTDRATYASPIVITQGDRRMAVFLTHQGVTALDPRSGERLWQYPLVDKLSESSTTPVRVGDVIFASSVTFGGVGLKLIEKDGQPASQQLWKNEQLTCYFSTPVAHGDQLYVVTGRLLPPSAQLHCVEAKTGKVLWTRRNVGKYHATVMMAGGRLLMLEERGDLVLIEPDPREYKELARAKVCGETWSHPALSDGRLYVRDAQELICVGLKRD